jgi:hypothetical protein
MIFKIILSDFFLYKGELKLQNIEDNSTILSIKEMFISRLFQENKIPANIKLTTDKIVFLESGKLLEDNKTIYDYNYNCTELVLRVAYKNYSELCRTCVAN